MNDLVSSDYRINTTDKEVEGLVRMHIEIRGWDLHGRCLHSRLYVRQNTKPMVEQLKQEFRGDSTSREGPEKQITVREEALGSFRVVTHSLGSQKTNKSPL